MSKILTYWLIVAGIALVAGGGYWFWVDDTNPWLAEKNQIACTQEAKLCSDGSYVGRTGPSCEFAPCPITDDIRKEAEKNSKIGPGNYRNEELGFVLDYQNWSWIALDEQLGLHIFFASFDDIFVFLENSDLSTEIEKIKNNIEREGGLEGGHILGSILDIKIGGLPAKKIIGIGKGDALNAYYALVERGGKVFIFIGNETNLIFFDKIIASLAFIEKSDTSTWKTYRNEKYGFEFKYPANFIVYKGFIGDEVIKAEAEDNKIWVAQDNNLLKNGEPMNLGVEIINTILGPRAWLDKNKQNYTDENEIKPIRDISFFGKDAVELSGGCNLGSVCKLIVVKVLDYLIIIANDGGTDLDQILSTFKFIK